MFSPRPFVCAVLYAVLLTISAASIPLPSDINSRSFRTREALAASTVPVPYRPHYSTGDTIPLFVEDTTYSLSTGGGSDCWGWQAPDGTEYAIMGQRRGMTFVNVTDGYVADTLLGPYEGLCGSAYWRDMATYQHYLYCVSECEGANEGLQVVDLQYLPDSVHLLGTYSVTGQDYMTSHNLSIDSIAGYLYLEGNGYANSGIYIHSLADPANPVYVGSFGAISGVPYYHVHDMYACSDTVYVANGGMSQWSIWDLTDKQNPLELARVSLPGFPFLHNIWPTEDHKYVVTTEETPYKTVKIWDVQNFNSVQLTAEYLGPNNLAHNAQLVGNRVFLSHYESGLIVLDISDKANPLVIGHVDTYLAGENPDYHGAWGVFPHTNTGHVYMSNVDGRLFIVHEESHQLTDSLVLGTAVVPQPGAAVRIPVIANRSVELEDIRFAIAWGGPLALAFDSASTAGLISESWPVQSLTSLDPFGSRLAYRLAAAPDSSFPVGRDTILNLYFTTMTGDSGAVNPVTITAYGNNVLRFSGEIFDIDPGTLSGSVTIDINQCCVGIRGNVDADLGDEITIQDLTVLVGYMFGSRGQLACPDEANINGDTSGTLDISDLTRLVDFMFKGGTSPAPCQN